MDTIALRNDIETIGDLPSLDKLAELRVKIDAMKELTKYASELWDNAMLARCEHFATDQTIGDIRYWAGTKKTTKCRNPGQAVNVVLEATGGDFDLLGSLLSSDPFKHGACRDVLGERWGEVFEVTEKPELKEGKPKKSLIAVNERFVK